MANRRKSTCKATTTRSKRCKNTHLIDGFCRVHFPAGVEAFDTKKAQSIEPKIAQPSSGFEDLISAVINPDKATDKAKKLDFVGGEWTEVPVEENILPVPAIDELDKAIAEYPYLFVNVTLSEIKDRVSFARLAISVANMSAEDLMMQLIVTTDDITKREDEAKRILQDAKYEYGEIPLDIKLDLEERNNIIFQIKMFKAVILAAVEIIEDAINNDEVAADRDVIQAPTMLDKIRSLFSKFTKFIPSFLIAVGVVLLIIATVVQTGDRTEPKVESEPNTAVVDDRPVVTEKEDVVKDTPSDSVGVSDTEPVVVDEPAVIAPDPVYESSMYAVQDGDTLWDIAEKVYGDGSQWVQIWDANKDMLTQYDARNATDAGHWIHPGQVINVADGLHDH